MRLHFSSVQFTGCARSFWLPAAAAPSTAPCPKAILAGSNARRKGTIRATMWQMACHNDPHLHSAKDSDGTCSNNALYARNCGPCKQ
eukprot:9972789-Alexandrium_andersonii.AAC.1